MSDKHIIENYLTATEISSCLRIPLNTIYRLTKRGSIKGVKVGKQWRYNKEEFEHLLNGRINTVNPCINMERRAYPRINCNFKCKSSIYIFDEKDFNLQDSRVTNLSADGMFMAIHNNDWRECVNVEDPISVNFSLVSDLDGAENNLDIKGRVVRKTYCGVGVKFRHMDNRSRQLINEFVD